MNSIVGAQVFHAVNSDVPGWAGVIVIAAGTGIITLFGYNIVHHYQRWSWIPSFIIFLIVLGEFAHSGRFRNLGTRPGSSTAGGVTSFAAAVFGSSTGWSTYAADYTVYMPPTTSRKKVFAYTFAGLCFPIIFLQVLGAAVGTATVDNTDFAAAYESAGIGGLLGAVLVPPLSRFGQFCMVVLALGIIANNCPNQYSISLNLQILSAKTQVVPRFIWTILSVIVFAALAIAGYGDFESFLRNFMLVMVSDRRIYHLAHFLVKLIDQPQGYWVAIYESISLTEHFVFLGGLKGYDAEQWTHSKTFPPGFASSVAASFGVLGAVLGMAQVWFIGPIGKLIGNPQYGGDIGFELAFAFSTIAYIPCRLLEKRFFKR